MGSVSSSEVVLNKRQGEPPESAKAAARHSSGGSLVISAGQPPQGQTRSRLPLDKRHRLEFQLLQLRILRALARIRVRIRRISRRIKRSIAAATIR
jgi:hypothetical protein